MATYKIKDLEVLTGIKAHTIRIWEKRYGILNPDRTDTKIRTYSDEELKLILNISILNNRGIKISKIADLSQKQIQNEVNKEKTEQCSVQEKLLLSLIDLDEDLFDQIIDGQISEIGIEDTFHTFIFPFLERIGIMWLVGSINPAQEHFISFLIRQKLISAVDKLKVEKTSKKVIFYLAEHETHELSLLFYHYVFKKRGFKTYYLGQNLPLEALVDCCNQINPEVIVTSWIASVDSKYMIDYFKQLTKLVSAKIYAGGFQIINNEKELAGYVNLIKNSSFLVDVEKLI
jgi:MerR family transcriptional regulator, light-induced transcriptional regulator